MMLFVIFALVVVIATGIPYVKKGIENRKLMKKYMESLEDEMIVAYPVDTEVLQS